MNKFTVYCINMIMNITKFKVQIDFVKQNYITLNIADISKS